MPFSRIAENRIREAMEQGQFEKRERTSS